jgi:hypothetical protein
MKQIYRLKIAETYKKLLKIKVAEKTIGKLSIDATEICLIEKYPLYQMSFF